MRCVGLLSPSTLTGDPADLVVNSNVAASRQDVRVIWLLQDEAEAFMLVPWRLLQASEIKHPWVSWRRVTTNVPKRTKNREQQVLHCLLLLLAGLQSSWQWRDTPTQRSCFTWRVFCWWMSKTTSWIELLIGGVRIQYKCWSCGLSSTAPAEPRHLIPVWREIWNDFSLRMSAGFASDSSAIHLRNQS